MTILTIPHPNADLGHRIVAATEDPKIDSEQRDEEQWLSSPHPLGSGAPTQKTVGASHVRETERERERLLGRVKRCAPDYYLYMMVETSFFRQ